MVCKDELLLGMKSTVELNRISICKVFDWFSIRSEFLGEKQRN
jgi:hypothetical protein